MAILRGKLAESLPTSRQEDRIFREPELNGGIRKAPWVFTVRQLKPTSQQTCQLHVGVVDSDSESAT